MQVSEKGVFDAEAFYSALDSARQEHGLTWKKVADQAGVSASTLTRMAQGKRPDVDSFSRLVTWSGLSADEFVVRPGSEQDNVHSSPLAKVTAQFRHDPRLPKAAQDAIIAVLRTMYDQFAKKAQE